MDLRYKYFKCMLLRRTNMLVGFGRYTPIHIHRRIDYMSWTLLRYGTLLTAFICTTKSEIRQDIYIDAREKSLIQNSLTFHGKLIGLRIIRLDYVLRSGYQQCFFTGCFMCVSRIRASKILITFFAVI